MESSNGKDLPPDWDPMKADFENSTFGPQNPNEEDNSPYSGGSAQLDHCRLHIANWPKALNEEGLRSLFGKYGQLQECYVSRDPRKLYALVRYGSPGEAKMAMEKINNMKPFNLSINIARVAGSRVTPPRWLNRSHNNIQGSYTKINTARTPETSSSVGQIMPSSSRRDMALERGSNEEMGDDVMGFINNIGSQLTEDQDQETEFELQNLKLKAAELLYKKQLQAVKNAQEKKRSSNVGSRCYLPDGKIQIQVEQTERNNEKLMRDIDNHVGAAGGDSRERECCSCRSKSPKWYRESSPERSSTPSTCVYCSERKPVAQVYKSPNKSIEKFEAIGSNEQCSINVKSNQSETRNSIPQWNKSEITCQLKFSEIYNYTDAETDETDRLMKMRSVDYLDIVDEDLKVVIALAGYPKVKMRLYNMEQFRRCLSEVMDMQLKAGLLKAMPVFFDYYLNRGAIVCICKDSDTKEWMVRISPGLEERMKHNLLFLKSKVKRLCLAVLRIPKDSWPATAQDAFKLLQYFNPLLKTGQWRINSQKIVDDVEVTSFVIDRISGEIIRGPSFKNVIDYNQMEFDLNGYTEIYYENLLSESEGDLCSINSEVKLINEGRSFCGSDIQIECDNNEAELNYNDHAMNFSNNDAGSGLNDKSSKQYNLNESFTVPSEMETIDTRNATEFLESTIDNNVLQKLKDIQYIGNKNDILIWSDSNRSQGTKDDTQDHYDKQNYPSHSLEFSDKTESLVESNGSNLISRNSMLSINTNRGIAYYRRTNYLHVENELKLAVTMEGYPDNKLEGTHIRRLKHLFKEYLHKDLKQQRFFNLIIPKFQDVYLSNGAVIYICDSLETKDYLCEILPKFVKSTGLKLTFRDINHLVRYTRVVMRLPKELAHLESLDILMKIKSKHPELKPDRWKYYSNVAGKQKRQFGVDPESLDVIKNPQFQPTFNGEPVEFRIIDRQKQSQLYDDVWQVTTETTNNTEETKIIREKVLKLMHVPLFTDSANTPLAKIRANHYSDMVADDLKLYVGPAAYPETRIDEQLFHSIKRAFENIVFDALDKGDLCEDSIPKFHDMYLFDGVIFIISENASSKHWIDQVLPIINNNLNLNLKPTEFRGAVGIISMVVKTDKDTDQVIDVLQQLNPRLRTKFWRKISAVRTRTKLDVVLQIDKLSALVITSPMFNKFIGSSAVHFKLGHLHSLLKVKSKQEILQETT